MKDQVYKILAGIALALSAASNSQAMSTLVRLSIEHTWPATTAPGNVLVYQITAVAREGSGMLEVALSSLGLPEGATVQFSPSVVRFTGHEPAVQTATMTITTLEPTATDNYPFTLTGTALRESVTITNQIEQELYSRNSGAPNLTLDRFADGSLRLRGKGATAQTYSIESTPSLTDPVWTPMGSTTADGNGRFTFNPGQSQNNSMRFFRAVQPGQ